VEGDQIRGHGQAGGGRNVDGADGKARRAVWPYPASATVPLSATAVMLTVYVYKLSANGDGQVNGVSAVLRQRRGSVWKQAILRVASIVLSDSVRAIPIYSNC
jgi:hypothetical protein